MTLRQLPGRILKPTRRLDIRLRTHLALGAGLLLATGVVWLCGEARAAILYVPFVIAAALCYE